MHPADETLAALVIGDEPEAATAEHLSRCERCQGVVAELAEVEMLLGEPEVHQLPSPPTGVWADITARLGPDRPSATDETNKHPEAGAPVAARGIPQQSRDLGAQRADPPAGRGPWSRWLAAAAAVALLLGGYAAGRLAGRDAPGAVPVVATATLTSMDGARRLGEAHVVSGPGGPALRVHVDATVPTPASGYVEVWLINTDLTRMVSIGTLAPGQDTELVVPAAAITAGYRIVDLSNEHFDDKPAHSGDSIMRGTLTS